MMEAITGRILWEQLHHIMPRMHVKGQRIAFEQWLRRVKFNMGCTTCFKKVEWFMEKWPVEFGTGFIQWGTCLHDYVNKELGKPLWAPHLTLEPLTKKGIIQ